MSQIKPKYADILQDAFKRLNEEPMAKGFFKDYYVKRSQSPTESLKNDIVNAGGSFQKQLFSGHRGSGKTTELYFLRSLLEQDDQFYVTFVAAINDIKLSDIVYTDLLFILIAKAINLLEEKNVRKKKKTRKQMEEDLMQLRGDLDKGPLLYDYKNKLNERYPNPILEGPLGLVALYNEIVFLNEAVCPKSMKELKFVKLLSDSQDIKDFFEREAKVILGDAKFPSMKFRPIAETIGPFATWDAHSRAIDLGLYIHPVPNSGNWINFLYDNIVSREKNLDLITNSFSGKGLIYSVSMTGGNVHKIDVAHSLPNYITDDGPDLGTIYEIRNMDFVKQLRKKTEGTSSLNKIKFDSD